MPRDITAGMDTAAKDTVIRPAILVKINTSGGDRRLWSGIGDITFASEIYSGVGDFGQISPVEETSDLKATGVNFILSGISSANISMALGDIQQGRPVKMWLGLFDSSNSLIADPELTFEGETDTPEIAEGPDTSTVTVVAENVLRDLERVRVRRYTDEDQKTDDPDDLGFEFVQALQDAEFMFGPAGFS